MIKRLIFLTIFAVFSIFAEAEEKISFDELQYFDKATLKGQAVLGVRMTVASTEITTANLTTQTCYKALSSFDTNGNLVGYDLNRMGSSSFYKYENNKLVDWGWVEKSSKKETSFAQELSEDQSEFEKQLATTQESLDKKLNSKIDFKESHVRYFSDPCLGAEGAYEIKFDNSTALPTTAKANLVSGENSVENLYFYFEYVVYK